MAVSFHVKSPITLRNRENLKSFLSVICRKEGKTLGDLSVVFVSDRELLDMNRQFLDHDYYTDIITFDLGGGIDQPVSGELYISTDRVRDNARTFGKSITNELHRVIFHGLLHLCGYTDKTLADQKGMRAKEDKYLKIYFTPE